MTKDQNTIPGVPCHSACPIATEAWRYIAHIARNEYDLAYEAIRAHNIFPSICARVCHHPCEKHCKLAKIGQPIAIRNLKRFVCDAFHGSIVGQTAGDPAAPGDYRPLVAIIGAGPAGLLAAHHLACQGIASTIFDREKVPGGMMISAIPAYRLPHEVLRREIEQILDRRIDLRLGTTFGRDFDIATLFQNGYRAVFLATGAHKGKRLNIEGEDSVDVLPSVEFLREFNLHGRNTLTGRVAVIGGGNSALDAARVALRNKGVSMVTVYYRRSREEMPAFREEIEAALEEGIRIETLISPIRILTRNGRVSGLILRRNLPGPIDEGGRQRPIPIEGSDVEVSVETIITALGERPETSGIEFNGLELTKWGTLKIDERTMMSSIAGVFGGGDLVRGPSSVVEAMADGRNAATTIFQYLNDRPLEIPERQMIPMVYIPRPPKEQRPPRKGKSVRIEANRLPLEQRGREAEVECVMSDLDARGEAWRCLRCDFAFIAERAQ